MSVKASGIVLAGGMSRRLGRDKALERVDGRRLITRVLGRMSRAFEENVVVVNDALRARTLPLPESARAVIDAYPGAGPLGGIFTGLSAVSSEWGVVVACDMPFLNVKLLRHMVPVTDGYDAVAPLVDGRPQPTHAAYSRSCLPQLESTLKAGRLSASDFLSAQNVRYLAEEEVDDLDPEHLSFFNVNSQQDLDDARALAARIADDTPFDYDVIVASRHSR